MPQSKSKDLQCRKGWQKHKSVSRTTGERPKPRAPQMRRARADDPPSVPNAELESKAASQKVCNAARLQEATEHRMHSENVSKTFVFAGDARSEADGPNPANAKLAGGMNGSKRNLCSKGAEPTALQRQ